LEVIGGKQWHILIMLNFFLILSEKKDGNFASFH
jgi:hypothetical protein